MKNTTKLALIGVGSIIGGMIATVVVNKLMNKNDDSNNIIEEENDVEDVQLANYQKLTKLIKEDNDKIRNEILNAVKESQDATANTDMDLEDFIEIHDIRQTLMALSYRHVLENGYGDKEQFKDQEKETIKELLEELKVKTEKIVNESKASS